MADIQNNPGFLQVLSDIATRCMDNAYEPTPLTRADLDHLMVDNGLITAPLGTPEASRQRSRIIGALHLASLREDDEHRLPYRLVPVDRKTGLYRILPIHDWARERPSQHFKEIQHHHDRQRKETQKLLSSKLVSPQTKALLTVYAEAVDNAIEGVKQTETKIMMAFHRGSEALEALGREIASEAAERRIGNAFSPLRALSHTDAIAAE
jgi:hypothetical protein